MLLVLFPQTEGDPWLSLGSPGVGFWVCFRIFLFSGLRLFPTRGSSGCEVLGVIVRETSDRTFTLQLLCPGCGDSGGHVKHAFRVLGPHSTRRWI